MIAAVRAAQIVYDFWLDLTGVTVGAYRRGAFVALYATTLSGFDVFWWHQAWSAPLNIPIGFLTLLAMPNARARARQDDRDQRSGRHAAVNRRAVRSVGSIGVTLLSVSAMVSLLALLFFESNPWYILVAPSFLSIYVNECLTVRDRDASRFDLRAPRAASAPG